MRNHCPKLTFFCLAALAILAVSARPASAALNAGNFLRFGVGARPLGMGNSFVAIADDATAVYWNPAGLVSGNIAEFFVSYANRFGVGIRDVSLGFTLPTERRYRLGAAFVRTSVDGITRSSRADADGRPIVEGSFGDSENAFILAMGYRLHRMISMGLATKFLLHQLDTWSANGLGFDLGFMFTPVDAISLGLNVQNLNNPRMRWNTLERSYDNISTNVKAGCAVRLFSRRLTVSLDADDSDVGGRVFHGGAEFHPTSYVGVRGGLSGHDPTIGASLSWRRLRLDYTFQAHELGDTYLISIAGTL
ncbi:MAG: PorV/PorQ family protein [candidate division Zixibacteria bacterium]|nr:PorV/PorQ family protein [candidate division Zixibacteria bacterium]